MGDRKKQQAQVVLDVLRSQAPLARGNPSWGNNKSHCLNGHEYATARMRPYVSRGVGAERRDNQRCLVCLRDYARNQRKKKRSADDDHQSIGEPAPIYLLK
jgi:hypothetical protein